MITPDQHEPKPGAFRTAKIRTVEDPGPDSDNDEIVETIVIKRGLSSRFIELVLPGAGGEPTGFASLSMAASDVAFMAAVCANFLVRVILTDSEPHFTNLVLVTVIDLCAFYLNPYLRSNTHEQKEWMLFISEENTANRFESRQTS